MLFFTLTGFELSVENCCDKGLVVHVGFDQTCDDGCCDDGEETDCCEREFIKKEAGLLTFVSQEFNKEYNSFTAAVVSITKSNNLPLTDQFISTGKHHIHQPARIMYCVFRC